MTLKIKTVDWLLIGENRVAISQRVFGTTSVIRLQFNKELKKMRELAMWMSEEWVLASSELSVTVPYNYCFESN